MVAESVADPPSRSDLEYLIDRFGEILQEYDGDDYCDGKMDTVHANDLRGGHRPRTVVAEEELGVIDDGSFLDVPITEGKRAGAITKIRDNA